MVLELIFGFLVLVAASYIGTTIALQNFFDRKRYHADFETNRGGPPGNGDGPKANDAPRTDRASRTDATARADDVPRASDVSSDDSGENE